MQPLLGARLDLVLPGVRYFEPAEGLLVLEWLEGTENWSSALDAGAPH